MKQKVIIVESVNLTPQDKVNEELAELKGDWKIVSATTNLAPLGTFTDAELGFFHRRGDMIPPGRAKHVYYVTTVVVEQAS